MATLEEELIKLNSYLERYSPLSIDEINTKLLSAQDEIIALVSSTQNKATIRKELNSIFKDIFTPAEEVLYFEDMPTIQALAWDATVVALATAESVTVAKFKDTKETIKEGLLNKNRLYQGFTLDEHFKGLENNTKNKLRGLIYNGFDNGEGIEVINDNIKSAIGNVNRNQSKTLVRTVLLENASDAQMQVFKEAEDLIKWYEYSAALDSRTSVYCTIADGYTVKDLSKAKYKPKSHYNCRSIWIPRFKGEDTKDEPQLLTEWDGKTVNHRTGEKSTKFTIGQTKEIPADVKSIDRLKYFDDKYLQEYLGKTRYNLYKSGKASFKDMFNVSRGKLLTLEQLNTRLNLD